MEDLLREYACGLDCAGSHESMYFDSWYYELIHKKMTEEQVMEKIRDRYSLYNKDVVKEFERKIERK